VLRGLPRGPAGLVPASLHQRRNPASQLRRPCTSGRGDRTAASCVGFDARAVARPCKGLRLSSPATTPRCGAYFFGNIVGTAMPATCSRRAPICVPSKCCWDIPGPTAASTLGHSRAGALPI